MAITIIKGGKNEFLGHCSWCGCDFRYTEEDVSGHGALTYSVDCPSCKRALKHLGEDGTGRRYDPMHGMYGQQNAMAAFASNQQVK